MCGPSSIFSPRSLNSSRCGSANGTVNAARLIALLCVMTLAANGGTRPLARPGTCSCGSRAWRRGYERRRAACPRDRGRPSFPGSRSRSRAPTSALTTSCPPSSRITASGLPPLKPQRTNAPGAVRPCWRGCCGSQPRRSYHEDDRPNVSHRKKKRGPRPWGETLFYLFR